MQDKIYILERLRSGLEKSGVKKRGMNPIVAEKTGYSPGMVAKLLSGHAVIGDRFIQAVCSSFGINPEWIHEGKEPVLLSQETIWERLKAECDALGLTVYASENKPQRAMNADQMRAYAKELAIQEKITEDMFNPLLEAGNNRQAIIAMINTLTGPQLKVVLKFIGELISKGTE